MRNNDVLRLRWDNFVPEKDSIYLKYVPHKTRLTSGRVVNWPVDEQIWEEILEYIGTVLDSLEENEEK